MKYQKKELFLVKGKIKPKYITGNHNTTNIITENLGYNLKKICHSNTHLLLSDTISQISNIYELRENKVDYDLLDSIFTKVKSVSEITNCDFMINLRSIQDEYGYGDTQINEVIAKFKLYKTGEGMYIRFDYGVILKMLQVYQSIIQTGSDIFELGSFYPNLVCDWIFKNFHGNEDEICVFLLLKLQEENGVVHFKSEIVQMICGNVNLANIINYLKTIYVRDRMELVETLKNLYGS